MVFIASAADTATNHWEVGCNTDAATDTQIHNGTAWSVENTTIASVTDNFYSVTSDGTSLWVLSVSGTTATNFYSCPTGCDGDSWSSQTAPFTGATNLTSASLTYDSTNSDLYAMVIKDASEQAYWNSTDAASISWTGSTSFGFTAGDLGHISSPMTGAGTGQMAVVLRQDVNFEFATIPEYTLFLVVIGPLAG